MKTLISVILTLVLNVVWAHARVGETLNELIKRFGEPVHRPFQTDFGQDAPVFLFKHWLIHVRLLNGKCAWESYSIAGGTQDFSQMDVDIVLGSNSRGKRWQPITEVDWDGTHIHTPSQTRILNAWKLEQGSLTAIQQKDSLMIISDEWTAYVTDKQSKERDTAVKDSGL